MINELYKYHKDWVRIVLSMGGGYYSEDIVQEAYIKIHLKKYDLLDDGIVNKTYMYVILHSVLIDYLRKKNKIVKFYIEDIKELERSPLQGAITDFYNKLNESISDNEQDEIEREAFFNLSTAIDKEVDSWHFYDKKCFNMYRLPLNYDLGYKTSIRKMEEATKISMVTIYETLKKAKATLKLKIKEDYEIYKRRR